MTIGYKRKSASPRVGRTTGQRLLNAETVKIRNVVQKASTKTYRLLH